MKKRGGWMGIGHTINYWNKTQPDKIAILSKEKSITYRDLYNDIQRFQYFLTDNLGKEKGKKVGILIGNEPEFIELFLAIVTLGWIAIPFDPKWCKKDVQHVLTVTRPDLLIRSTSFSQKIDYGNIPIISIDVMENVLYNESIVWEQHDEEMFYYGFTSGSTGTPKGFMRNHRSWLKSFLAAEEAFQYQMNDTIVAPGPLCHSLSLFAAIHTIHLGATFYVLPKFKRDEVIQLIHDEVGTVFYVVPTMLQAIVQENVVLNNAKPKILSSGAKLTKELRQKVKKYIPNSKIYEFYGASELSFVSYTDESILEKAPKSVGKPFPGVEIIIQKENGEIGEIEEIGEVIVNSDFLFSGYVGEQVATEQVLTNKGANIGDLGFIDKEGLLNVVGRKKNMMITGGLNVYPEEVESVIKELEEVEEAAVIGIDDDYWGQKMIAFIQFKNEASVEKVKDYCKKRLASYKCPKEYYIVQSFPYTSSGKIARSELKQSLKGVSS